MPTAGNIADNDLVEIISENGRVRVKAKFSNDIKKGVVFLPMHWGKILNSDLNRANNLTNNLTDPVSKEPDFKFTRVRVERYIKTYPENYCHWSGCRRV